MSVDWPSCPANLRFAAESELDLLGWVKTEPGTWRRQYHDDTVSPNRRALDAFLAAPRAISSIRAASTFFRIPFDYAYNLFSPHTYPAQVRGMAPEFLAAMTTRVTRFLSQLNKGVTEVRWEAVIA